jgi:hypothetical protein
VRRGLARAADAELTARRAENFMVCMFVGEEDVGEWKTKAGE